MADDEEKSQISDQDRGYIRSGKMGACFAPALGLGLLLGMTSDSLFGSAAGLYGSLLGISLGLYIGYLTVYKK